MQITNQTIFDFLCRALEYHNYTKENSKITSKYQRKLNGLRGLSRLSKCILDFPLDKREQMSNWLFRPIRIEQMNYAALDAYCLLPIYEFFNKLQLQMKEVNLAVPNIKVQKSSENTEKKAVQIEKDEANDKISEDMDKIRKEQIDWVGMYYRKMYYLNNYYYLR